MFALGLLTFAGSLAVGLYFSLAWQGHPPGIQLETWAAGVEGRYELAVRQLERALQIDPNLEDARRNLELARAALGSAETGS